MSLCIVTRPADGGIIMCADTAISMEYMGKTYRVSNVEDDEKIIEHNGALIFCSGNYEKCKQIRAYIRGMDTLNLVRVQEYAQELFGHNIADDSTGILVCWEDGSLVGMLSAQDFKLVPLLWPENGLGIHVLGFHMKEAHQAMCEASKHTDYVIQAITEAYSAVLSEEVGGHIWMYSRRADTPWRKIHGEFAEPDGIKRLIAERAEEQHCIVQAKDFLLGNGTSLKSALTDDKTKIKGEYIDARGINILDDNGHQVLYIDATGIHWTPKYNPFKIQYSVSANGPWHDTYAANDEYRRESTDGGITWGPGIKYVAKDGKDGSDANVPSYVQLKGLDFTDIGASYIKSPKIWGGELRGADIYGGGFWDLDGKSKLVLNKTGSISKNADLALYSGDNIAFNLYDNITGSIDWSSYGKHFLTTGQFGAAASGSWDFSGADVKGVTATFG